MSRSQRNPAIEWGALATAVVLAVAFRMIGLGDRPLWLDETITWWNATRPTWQAAALSEVRFGPVWWLITRAFVHPLGDSPAVLRAPAVLFGVLAVGLTYGLTRSLFVELPESPCRPRRVHLALGVALLAAVHPFWLEYSQEARMYSALLAAALGLSLLHLSALRHGRLRTYVAYALVGAIALGIQPLAVLVFAVHAVHAAVETAIGRPRPPRSRVLSLAVAQWVALLSFAPWAFRAIRAGASMTTLGNYSLLPRLALAMWRLAFGPTLAAIDRPRIDAGPLQLIRAESPILVLGTVAILAASLAAFRGLRAAPSARRFLLLSLLLPPGLLLLVYARYPFLHERFLIMVAPAVLIWVVAGVGTAPRALRPWLLAAVLIPTLLGTLAFLAPGNGVAKRLVEHGHPYGKEDWPDAHAWIATRWRAGDVLLVYPWYLRIPWDYYDRGRIPAETLSRLPETPGGLLAQVPALTSARHVFLLSGAVADAGRDSLARRLADWAARDPEATGPGGTAVGSHAFPTRWGLWTWAYSGFRSDFAAEPPQREVARSTQAPSRAGR